MPTIRSRRHFLGLTRLALGGTLALLLAGCGANATTPNQSDTHLTPTASGPHGTITVLAAASLTEAFTELGKDFEAQNTGVKVRFAFGASSALAQQIIAGNQADVFASASPTNLKQVADHGDTLDAGKILTRNQLVIAVAKGNPKGVHGLADLGKPGLKVAVCAPAVPCGVAANKALAAGNVRLTPSTQEPDVKAALTKLRLGEVDAALVYRTDTLAPTSRNVLEGVEFPESAKAVNDYPVVLLKRAPNYPTGLAFVNFLFGDFAQGKLSAAGFQSPGAPTVTTS